MNKRICRLVVTTSLVMAGVCAGCGPKLDVFDKAAINKIGNLLIVPLASPQERGAGPTASGMLLTRLRAANHPRLQVVSSPALWRIRHDGGEIPQQLLARKQALELAREMGADAVLTGSADYSLRFAFSRDVPEAVRKMKGSATSRFATSHGTASVELRLIRVADDRDVYVNRGSAKGHENSKVLSSAIAAAIKPLEAHLGSRPKQPKE